MLGLADLTHDIWLEVSLHPEGPATGKLDQGKNVRGWKPVQENC
jgi:hypothetical protein